jgi:uncharacterized repeat protein (TIGR01451 family)
MVMAALFLGRGALAAPASPLSVVKSASVSSVATGGQLTYTITITNTGGSSVGNAVLTDQVNGIGVIQSPPALPQLQVTSTKGSCTQGGPNGNVVTCNGGTLAGGASWTVTIGGQVTAGANTTLNNTAYVSATKTSQSFTTPSNPVSVLVTGSGGNLPDLTINKTGPTTVAPSSPITYTLTVNNIGGGNATGVKVVDTVPAGIGSISASGTSLFNCGVSAQTVTCTGGQVNQGQNATITINGTVTLTSGTLTNTAVVDPDNTIPESNEFNNTSATVNTNVGGPPAPALLEIKKTDGSPLPTVDPGDPPLWWAGAGPDPVNPGQTLTYKILVVNEATGTNPTATSLVVTDGTQGLDASSIVASETVVNGTVAKTDGCTVTAPQVRCTVKALNSLGTVAITISGTVIQSAGSTIFNSATVTGNIRNQGVTNTATEATTVRPRVDLTVTDDGSPNPVCAHSWPVDSPTNQHLPTPPNGLSPASGHPVPLLQTPDCLGGLTYSLVVGNSGNGPATGVEVRDPLPTGAIFDSYQDVDGAGFTCALQPGNVVDCTGGSIGPASIVHLNLLVVAPPNVGSITNVVTVDPNNTIFESDETNNTVSQTTQVSTGVDLVVWKGHKAGVVPPGSPTYKTLTEGFDPVATNGTETYTIYVDNVGTQDTTNVKVVDTLPAGTKFLSVKADQGFTCSQDGSATGGNVTCIGGHLLGTESESYTAPQPGGSTAAGEDHATITIKVFATPNVQPAMHNEVRVDPDNTIPEANELNNLYTDDATVGTGNDDKGAFNQLTIAKTQVSPSGGGTVATNGKVTYDLEVSNLGTDPVSNVVVKDTLPTGSRFISASDLDTTHAARFFCSHDGSPNGGVVTCTGGDFSGSLNTIPDNPGPGNVPITRHIRITVFAPNTPGTYTNHATVDPDNVVPEGNEFDNDSSVDTTVAPCVGLSDCTNENAFNELTITKTQVSPANPVARNAIVTYNLKVQNLGSDPAQGVVATDRLPAGFRFINAKDSSPGDPTAFTCGGPDASGVLTCSGGSLSGTVNALPGGAPTSRTIVVRVFAPDTPGTYDNLAFVDPNNTIAEGNEFNNQSSAETDVKNGGNGPYIDLQLIKTQEAVLDQDQPGGTGTPVRVAPGGPIKYVLEVKNLATPGPDGGDAFNVKVTDTLPANVTFFSAADEGAGPGNFSCGQRPGQPNTIDCTGGTIPAGASRKIDIFAVAPTNLAAIASDKGNIQQTLTNSAMVDPDNAIPEGDETNNVSSVNTLVQSEINLSLTKDGPGSASQNETTTYTIKVTNNKVWGNGQTAFNTTIVDPLPTGLIPLNVQADPGNFQCQILENPVNTVTCTGDLESTKSVTITISAFVTLESGTLDNEACVNTHFTPTTIDETDLTDNCNHAISQVKPPAPDLQINKTADVNSVTAGQKLTYKLNVSNVGTGPTDGTPVVVTDNVPSDVTVDQVVPPAGWDCSATVGNNVSCTVPSMNNGDSADIEIDTTVGSPTAPFTNTASVDGGGDLQTNNNSSSVKTLVGTASAIDLHVVSITDNPDPVNHGNTLTYTSIVRNEGTSDSGSGAVVRVVLPSTGVSNLAVTASNGFSCGANLTVDPSGKTFDCIGDFGASGTATDSTTITATMVVDAGAPPPDQLALTVTADPDNAIAESDETNNTLTETTTVSGTVCGGHPCIDLFATAAGTPLTSSGGPAIYFATVQNVGTDPVPDNPTTWTIEFSIAGAGTINSVIAPVGVTCLPPLGPVVDCSSNPGNPDPMDLAPGASVMFTINATDLDPPAGPGLLFQTTADSTSAIPELNEGNNTAIVPTLTSP